MDVYTSKTKIGNLLHIDSPMFETKMVPDCGYFCGQPTMYLVVWEKGDSVTATIGIHDEDDFDVYHTYENTTKEFVNELINKMKDYEYHEITDYDEIFTILDLDEGLYLDR